MTTNHASPDAAAVTAVLDKFRRLDTVTEARGSAALEELTLYLTTYDSTALEPICDDHTLSISTVQRRDADAPGPAPVEVVVEFDRPQPSRETTPSLTPDDITRALGAFAARSCVTGATYNPEQEEVRVLATTQDSTVFGDICGWFNLALHAFYSTGDDLVDYRFQFQHEYEPYDQETIADLQRRQTLLDQFSTHAVRDCAACGGPLQPQTILVSAELLPESYAQLKDRLDTLVLVFDEVETAAGIVRAADADARDSGGVLERGWQCQECPRTIIWPNAAAWLTKTFTNPDEYDPQRHPAAIQPRQLDRP